MKTIKSIVEKSIKNKTYKYKVHENIEKKVVKGRNKQVKANKIIPEDWLVFHRIQQVVHYL